MVKCNVNSVKFAVVLALCLSIGAKGEDKPRVIIVGAGVSGIAAATKLWKNGFTNVKIIEAENRMGGRIKTVPFADGVVDLGAEWLWGKDQNVLYNMTKTLDVLERIPDKLDFWLSNGNKLDEETGKTLLDVFDSLYDNKATNTYEGPEVNMMDYFTLKYKEKVQELFKDKPEKLKIALDAMTLWKTFINTDEGTLDWKDACVKNNYVWSDGDEVWNLKGKGMQTILDVLLDKIPDASKALPIEEHIQYGIAVTKITWKGVPKVKVDLADGTTKTADYVIWTPSVGVLKEKHSAIFEPQLPEAKTNALKSVGVGVVVKILLEFPEKWWPEKDFVGMGLMWSKEDADSLDKDYPKGNLMDTNWLLDVAGFWPVNGNPKVLQSWVAGKTVPDVEKMSDDDIIDGLTFILNKFLTKDFKPVKPTKIIKEPWISNPNFKGAWMYESVDSAKLETPPQTTLSEPLIGDNSKPTVLFAGEFTHLHYYSTVNGAVETGWREAERIIKEHSKQ